MILIYMTCLDSVYGMLVNLPNLRTSASWKCGVPSMPPVGPLIVLEEHMPSVGLYPAHGPVVEDDFGHDQLRRAFSPIYL